MKILFDYNRTLYNPETETLYPGVTLMLEKLSKRHELYLVSQKEPGRADRFKTLGIHEYFTTTYFVEKKTVELFLEILGTDTAVIIGDSLGNEIRIGNTIGVQTIHIQRNSVPSLNSVRPDFTVRSIDEIEKILQTYEN